MTKPLDRRVRRTHRLLLEALLSFLTKTSWEKITINDICEAADVGRSTFYNHFADKEDLLLSGFHELQADLTASVASSGDELGFVGPLLDHAEEHRFILEALLGRRSADVVRKHFAAVIADVLSEAMTSLPTAVPKAATANFVAGAFIETLGWWFSEGAGTPRAEVEAHFLVLARGALAAQDGERQAAEKL